MASYVDMGALRLLKQLGKRVLYRPAVGSLGRGSVVMLPRWLHNKKHIDIGERCVIGRFAVINAVVEYGGVHYQPMIVIGHDVYIGGYVQLHCMQRLTLEQGVVVSEHVYISDIAHGLDPAKGPIMQQELECKGPVHIGAQTFIGYGVSILPGVSLGAHCIVGTRSVVTHSFPAYSMIAGSPAKLIKRYCMETKAWVKVS
jgi:acetyltransferase-like isoleucine patch superfamily enzyme